MIETIPDTNASNGALTFTVATLFFNELNAKKTGRIGTNASYISIKEILRPRTKFHGNY